MVRFERRNDKNSRDNREKARNMRSRSRESVDEKPKGKEKYAGRESKRNSRNRRDFKLTQVTCADCGVDCEVPFTPTSHKPIFCEVCFSKKNQLNSEVSKADIDKINEKLNKIMEALKIK